MDRDAILASAHRAARSRKLTITERVLDRVITRLIWTRDVIADREWRKRGIKDGVVDPIEVYRAW